MTKFDLESLGITREEIISRVVDQITERVMTTEIQDEDSTYRGDSDLADRLNEHVVAAVNAKVAELAARFVVPGIGTLIENFTLQKTTTWGEKTGERMTFTEYLVSRADAYLREEVDSDGRSREECSRSGHSWYGAKGQARVSYLINNHLHYEISTAMKKALQEANSAIVGGIESTVKAKLAEIQKGIQLTVKVKD